MTRLVLGLAVILALAACGAEGETDAAGDGDGGDEASAPATSLAITVWPEGRDSGTETSLLLECDPPGGDHPAAEEACAVLAASPDLLEPLPADVMCTQQFGGPEQAQIVGLHQAREVDLRYSRANGCEIARWDALAAVFDTAPAS